MTCLDLIRIAKMFFQQIQRVHRLLASSTSCLQAFLSSELHRVQHTSDQMMDILQLTGSGYHIILTKPKNQIGEQLPIHLFMRLT
jgi:hypothetical protein